ncbi:MAG: alpha/beta fold hydrolase, partial [Sandaracinaceae bacterium]|nr:alpha/beta fold hydrolase [Sandaracinaceae bacterium]
MSDRPDAAYEVGWYADVVGGFVDRLGLEDLDVVGHSYGGAVAQHLVLSRRERVRTLALLAPGGWGRNVGIGLHALRVLPEWLLQPLLGAGTRLAFAAMAPANAPHAEWLASRPSSARALIRTARAAVDARGARILASDFVDRLTELPPTLMLWGDRDRVLP